MAAEIFLCICLVFVFVFVMWSTCMQGTFYYQQIFIPIEIAVQSSVLRFYWFRFFYWFRAWMHPFEHRRHLIAVWLQMGKKLFGLKFEFLQRVHPWVTSDNLSSKGFYVKIHDQVHKNYKWSPWFTCGRGLAHFNSCLASRMHNDTISGRATLQCHDQKSWSRSQRHDPHPLSSSNVRIALIDSLWRLILSLLLLLCWLPF